MPPVSPATAGRLAPAQQPHDRVPARGLRLRARRPRHASRCPHGVRLVGGQRPAASDVGTLDGPGRLDAAPAAAARDARLPAAARSTAKASVGADAQAQEDGRGQSARRATSAGATATSRQRCVALWAPGARGGDDQGRADGVRERPRPDAPTAVAGPAGLEGADRRRDRRAQRSTFGYTFVSVSEGSPETLDALAQRQARCVTGPVNTGIPRRRPRTGTFPSSSTSPSVTMSGTNPDGSHYIDPGDPVGQLLQRRRRAARLPPRPVRVPAEPGLRRDAATPTAGRGVPVHADRHAGSRHVVSRRPGWRGHDGAVRRIATTR